MSYRSVAANFAKACQQNVMYRVTYGSGEIGRIAGVDDRDAAREAAAVAKRRRTTVVSLVRE